MAIMRSMVIVVVSARSAVVGSGEDSGSPSVFAAYADEQERRVGGSKESTASNILDDPTYCHQDQR